MNKAKLVASILAITATLGTAQAATFQSVGSACAANGAQGFTDASAMHMVACVDGKWVDVANLSQVAVKFDALSNGAGAQPSRWILNQVGLVGVPVHMAVSNETGYAASVTAPEVKVATLSTGLSAVATVVSLKPDSTAHVLLDIDASKVTGSWHKHIEMDIPVGVKTTVAQDSDGVTYAITVGKLAS